MVAELMDSDTEKQSHQRVLVELKEAFGEPLKRLGGISEDEWRNADQG
ncbi:MAG TPA: hypothetical protein VFY83_08320 [Anaerolineales bacterium]|nr:hypothetical protein [Anaerolineales bacterium]